MALVNDAIIKVAGLDTVLGSDYDTEYLYGSGSSAGSSQLHERACRRWCDWRHAWVLVLVALRGAASDPVVVRLQAGLRWWLACRAT